ncbi:hypothetical protein DAPPUDRAFT_323032 [Daphnia pulex]|uniref:Lipid-binding serum glycoprotein N-terminal domain-containing protein n=1 Tax=Daphnia pulex TaxID=6669 RepID=E9GXQ7_DAPPU|nr:hypothetical protein DAPPUDRAFT_323032 [Daphnia pulex]|eukprot:EFX75772.1 hypothetical protein DAPPUDRAFT_323032 [Daphnia pulex]
MKWYAFFVVAFFVTRAVDADPLREKLVETFFPHLDPVELDDPFVFNIIEEQLTVQGSVDSVVINGLSKYTVNRWFVDAEKSKIEFDISFAQLSSTGRYNIDGILIKFFPLQGSGNFKTDLRDIRITGSIEIEKDNKNGVSFKAIKFDTHFEEFTIQLDNTGNELDDTINEILSVVLVDLFYQYEKEYKAKASESIKESINQYLETNKIFRDFILGYLTHTPVKENKPESSDRVIRDISKVVDTILASVRNNATVGGWDPIRLPSDSDEFSVTLFRNFTINGQVSISNARIGGFSTVHRTGPCTLDLRPTKNEAEVVVFVGGNDIELGVDIMWGVGIFKTNLQIEMIVRHVDLMVDIIADTETFAVTLSQFLLNEIGTVKITIGGIPGGGSDIISNRLTLVSNLVKDSLIYAFQEALKPSVEKLVSGLVFKSFLTEELLAVE